jgi:hypothetical protein
LSSDGALTVDLFVTVGLSAATMALTLYIQLKKGDPVIDSIGLAVGLGTAMAIFLSLVTWFENNVYQLPWKLGALEQTIAAFIAVGFAIAGGSAFLTAWEWITQRLGLRVPKADPEAAPGVSVDFEQNIGQ